MTEDGQAAGWRRRLARPVALVGLIGGAALFLPQMMRHEVRFVPQPADPRCVRYATVALEQDGDLLRSFKLLANRDGIFDGHVLHLPEGEYLAQLRLQCASGDVTDREPQPVVVDGEGTLYLRIQSVCTCDDA